MKSASIVVAVALSAVVGMGLAGCSSTTPSNSDSKNANTPAQNEANANDNTAAEAPAGDVYVDVDWLKANLDKVVVLDARSSADFMTQHIPGAVNLHWTDVSNVTVQQGEAGWAELLDPATLAAAVSRLGIDNSKPVVVYTDATDGWGEDGRMFWTLREAGVEDIHMLNGGWTQWLYQQGAHDSGLKGDDMDAIDQVDTAFVKENQGTAVLVDARSPEEYSGAMTMGEARNGHIPGAVSVPYVGLINEDGTMKTAEELEKMFADAGLAKNDKIIVYCTGGVRAAAVAEALAAQGYTDVSVYAAGYSEWAGDSKNPIE